MDWLKKINLMLELKKWPDESLKIICKEVFNFKEAEKYKNEMTQIMNDNYGMGLAANQVGLTYRFFLMNYKGIIQEFVNPVINFFSDEKNKDVEGCLSFPKLKEEVKRSNVVEVTYQDFDRKTYTETYSGVYARCIQHEIDHLNGLTWLDRISSSKKNRILKKYE